MREKLLQLPRLHGTARSHDIGEYHGRWQSAGTLGVVVWVLHVDNTGYRH